MSTFASDFIEGFDARWSEVNTLIDMAQGLDDGDKEYCALCRATIVLIVANFEGFIYEAMRCFINDVNSNNAFSMTSEKMKMTYCTQFITPEKGNERKLRKLVDVFNELDTKYAIEPFLYENNKNPKATVIEKYFEEVGGKNFWKYISECEIDKVFENNSSIGANLIEKMKDVLRNGTLDFPYQFNCEDIGFNMTNNSSSIESLWKVFLNQTLKARHDVAHGISLDNTMPLSEIILTEEKVKILELSFAILMLKAGMNQL